MTGKPRGMRRQDFDALGFDHLVREADLHQHSVFE
jgi:hypothetical protein